MHGTYLVYIILFPGTEKLNKCGLVSCNNENELQTRKLFNRASRKNTLFVHLQKNNISIAEWIRIDPNQNLIDTDIDDYLDRIQYRGRSEYNSFQLSVFSSQVSSIWINHHPSEITKRWKATYII